MRMRDDTNINRGPRHASKAKLSNLGAHEAERDVDNVDKLFAAFEARKIVEELASDRSDDLSFSFPAQIFHEGHQPGEIRL